MPEVRRPDYYKLLGIPSTASQEQIKAAYRRQALKYHPDKNPDSAENDELFKQCSQAYSVLTDPAQRARYDASRLDRGVPELARDLLEEILSGRRRRRRDGADVRYEVKISLREAVHGAERRVSFTVADPCTACGGDGAAPGGSAPCPACNGRGFIKDRPGFFSLPRPCARCGGQGRMITKSCPECSGVGTVERVRDYTIKLPPGVRDGDVKLLDHEGEQGSGGGRAGDLLIVVRVTPHPLLKEQGHDLMLEAPVRFAVAALGGGIDVPTLDGSVRMKIPAGTQSGRTFRLKGRGLHRPQGGRGDQLVLVQVETPVGLEPEQRELLEAFDRSCDAKTHPQHVLFEERSRELEK